MRSLLLVVVQASLALWLVAGFAAVPRVEAAPGPAGCEHAGFDRATFQRQLRQYLSRHYPDPAERASAVSALGALGGFAVQEGIRQQLVVIQKQPETRVFAVDKGAGGERYYSGRFLDQLLLSEDPRRVSLWSLVRDGAVRAGETSLPEIATLLRQSEERLGTPAFGVPDPIPDYPLREPPAAALQHHWKAVQNLLVTRKANPLSWGCEVGLVAQEWVVQNRDRVPPGVAARIFMEAAIPMSRIDGERLGVR